MSKIDQQIVHIAAENIGIELISSEAKDLVLREAEYSVRQIIETAQKYMRKSHRRSLHPSNVQRALNSIGVDRIYGFPSSEKLSYVQDSHEDALWYLTSPECAISSVINSELIPPAQLNVHSHWLLTDGKVPDIPENQAENKLEEDDIEEVQLQITPPVPHILSLEQQIFFNQILESLSQGLDFKSMIESLSTDSSLNSLIPYIANSIYCMLCESNDLQAANRATKMLGALVANPYLNVEPFLHKIMPSLLSALLGKVFEDDAHWTFRESTATTIAMICEKYNTKYEFLKTSVLHECYRTLEDYDRTPYSHFGALKGIEAFGPAALREVLMPLLNEYMAFLDNSLKKKEIREWLVVKNALFKSSQSLTNAFPDLYSELETLFGEGITKNNDSGEY